MRLDEASNGASGLVGRDEAYGGKSRDLRPKAGGGGGSLPLLRRRAERERGREGGTAAHSGSEEESQ